MGGKNSQQAPPPAYDNSANEAMMAQVSQIMMAMMASQQAQSNQMMRVMQQAQAQQDVPMLPEIITEPEVDWTEKTQELRNKMKAEYTLDKARRIGREDTVLTSPFLDDEEADVTGSLLQQ